jgi:hypothetical protein
MQSLLQTVLLVLLCGVSLVSSSAQVGACPLRPALGSPINNPLNLYSQNGTLSLGLTLKNAADFIGGFGRSLLLPYGSGERSALAISVKPG